MKEKFDLVNGIYVKADGLIYRVMEYGKPICKKCEARILCQKNTFLQEKCKTIGIARLRKLRKGDSLTNPQAEE